MKYPAILLFCLLALNSCLSEEEKRLQTDQTFEGEEMFYLTYSLDEHVAYAFRPFDFYLDTVNHADIPGCPSVSVDEAGTEVVLAFGEGGCATNLPLRSGKLILSYQQDTTLEEHTVTIDYENYWVRGIKLEGSRKLYSINSVLDSVSGNISLIDSLANYVFTDVNRSTSKMSGVYSHEIFTENDSIRSFTTTGSVSGRNLTGRQFIMEVIEPKRFSADCVQGGYQVPESGQERWIIERSVEANVVHTLNYQSAEDCNHAALIQLNDGSELLKNQ